MIWQCFLFEIEAAECEVIEFINSLEQLNG